MDFYGTGIHATGPRNLVLMWARKWKHWSVNLLKKTLIHQLKTISKHHFPDIISTALLQRLYYRGKLLVRTSIWINTKVQNAHVIFWNWMLFSYREVRSSTNCMLYWSIQVILVTQDIITATSEVLIILGITWMILW